jgi:hypothetical protein
MASIREQQIVGDGRAGIEDEDGLIQELAGGQQGQPAIHAQPARVGIGDRQPPPYGQGADEFRFLSP